MEDVHLSIDDVCSLDYFHDFPASERQAFYGVREKLVLGLTV